jgi:hypothetical protein
MYIGGTFIYAGSAYLGYLFFKPAETLDRPSEKDRLTVFGRLAREYDDKIGFEESFIGTTGMRKELMSQINGNVLEVAGGKLDVLTTYFDSITLKLCAL